MCITSETCRANSVIKTALNNLHQAGPNKTHLHILNNLHHDLADENAAELLYLWVQKVTFLVAAQIRVSLVRYELILTAYGFSLNIIHTKTDKKED